MPSGRRYIRNRVWWKAQPFTVPGVSLGQRASGRRYELVCVSRWRVCRVVSPYLAFLVTCIFYCMKCRVPSIPQSSVFQTPELVFSFTGRVSVFQTSPHPVIKIPSSRRRDRTLMSVRILSPLVIKELSSRWVQFAAPQSRLSSDSGFAVWKTVYP